jgi:hypothetical protein
VGLLNQLHLGLAATPAPTWCWLTTSYQGLAAPKFLPGPDCTTERLFSFIWDLLLHHGSYMGLVDNFLPGTGCTIVSTRAWLHHSGADEPASSGTCCCTSSYLGLVDYFLPGTGCTKVPTWAWLPHNGADEPASPGTCCCTSSYWLTTSYQGLAAPQFLPGPGCTTVGLMNELHLGLAAAPAPTSLAPSIPRFWVIFSSRFSWARADAWSSLLNDLEALPDHSEGESDDVCIPGLEPMQDIQTRIHIWGHSVRIHGQVQDNSSVSIRIRADVRFLALWDGE